VRVGPDDLLQPDLLGSVASVRHADDDLIGGGPVDDDGVEAGDQVSNAGAVGDRSGAVEDPPGHVVEQLLGDLWGKPVMMNSGAILAVSPMV
jgi:hypothetical protein